jgi:hypothetical protein
MTTVSVSQPGGKGNPKVSRGREVVNVLMISLKPRTMSRNVGSASTAPMSPTEPGPRSFATS